MTIPQSIPTQFAQTVATYPNRIAIHTSTQTITYRELYNMANRIAAALAARRGTGAEPIALLFGQESAAFAATFGVLRSGKFYVMLEPLYPVERLTEILADSDARLVLTNSLYLELATELCGSTIEVVNIDVLTAENSSLPLPELSPTDYAYIGYTSGSTGKPKGVIENHCNPLHQWRCLLQEQPAYRDDRVLFLNRLSFSGGQLALHLTLLSGATLYLYDIHEAGIAQLPDWIDRHQITVWNSVPSLFRAFVAQIADRRQVASLRLVRLASDTVSHRDIEAFQRFFAADCQLWLSYAMTESKTITTRFLDQTAAAELTAIPCGFPIEGIEVWIADDVGKPQKADTVGEIVVHTRYLSPGYWRRPEETAARFLPDPTVPDIYTIFTGDLGKICQDGNLIHMGRKDSQVKILGHRVELAEIDAALTSLPMVRVGVTLCHDDDKSAMLTAYLVLSEQRIPSAAQLRSQLAPRLPAYMIPHRFLFLEQLPLNFNGKIDRKALSQLAQPMTETSYVAPRTPVEVALATIWAESLDREAIGIHDEFLTLGGDSLSAIQIVAEVVRQFGLDLPLSTLFQTTTVAQMALLITQHQAEALDPLVLEEILAELNTMAKHRHYSPETTSLVSANHAKTSSDFACAPSPITPPQIGNGLSATARHFGGCWQSTA